MGNKASRSWLVPLSQQIDIIQTLQQLRLEEDSS